MPKKKKKKSILGQRWRASMWVIQPDWWTDSELQLNTHIYLLPSKSLELWQDNAAFLQIVLVMC